MHIMPVMPIIIIILWSYYAYYHDHIIIIILLWSYYNHIIMIRLYLLLCLSSFSSDFLMIVLRFSSDFLMILLWFSYDFLMIWILCLLCSLLSSYLSAQARHLWEYYVKNIWICIILSEIIWIHMVFASSSSPWQ